MGKRLIAAKALVKHGEWQQWLEKNFQLSQQMANRFMRAAERFSKMNFEVQFSQTQMFEMLSLPSAEETEKFIEEKASEGKRVADMTIKQ